MKNNNKNRKLKFIRAKNNLRLGKTRFYSISKISNELYSDEDVVNTLAIDAKKALYDSFKLQLNTLSLIRGYSEDDFVKNLYTIRISLSRF